MTGKPLNEIIIGIKGAGEMASAVAWRLYQANLRRIFMMEVPQPLAVRRRVAFCEALHTSRQTVEGITALRTATSEQIQAAWADGCIAVVADPAWQQIQIQHPDVVVDAILAKRNLGTSMAEAPLVIGLGPGFTAGHDTHLVIETNRGHHLGRILTTGSAQPNTGIPGNIGGFTEERVLRAPIDGLFSACCKIGTIVTRDERIGSVGDDAVQARIGGVIRGLIRSGVQVPQGLKLGDIDPRGDPEYCGTISDKARAIAGSVLEALLRVYLAPLKSAADVRPASAKKTYHPASSDHFESLVDDIQHGDMRAIAKAIEWAENRGADAEMLLDLIRKRTGQAHRIGVTGPPGSGKSTLVNQLIKHFRRQNLAVGVIAVDPSSPFTGGALFGDRLRMAAAHDDPGVYIRSMGTRGSLGGLTRQAITVADILDAAHKEVVILETVGVGQIEIDIVTAADTIIVVAVPEAGDVVQSMKAGLMEIGHIFVVNKTDLPGAERMQRDLGAALHMQASTEPWQPVVIPAMATTGKGLDAVVRAIEAHRQFLETHGGLSGKRRQQAAARVQIWINEYLSRRFWTTARKQRLTDYLGQSDTRMSPRTIAQKLFAAALDRGK